MLVELEEECVSTERNSRIAFCFIMQIAPCVRIAIVQRYVGPRIAKIIIGNIRFEQINTLFQLNKSIFVKETFLVAIIIFEIASI